MTPKEKLEKIRALQDAYLRRIDGLKANYRQEVRTIMGKMEKKKVAKIRADLGI